MARVSKTLPSLTFTLSFASASVFANAADNKKSDYEVSTIDAYSISYSKGYEKELKQIYAELASSKLARYSYVYPDLFDRFKTSEGKIHLAGLIFFLENMIGASPTEIRSSISNDLLPKLESVKGQEQVNAEQLRALGATKPMIALIGHGSKNQFNISKLDALHADVEKFVKSANLRHPGGWILVYGGDSANPEKPDVGYLAKYIHDTFSIPVLAIQSDIVRDKYGGVQDWIDLVHYVKTDSVSEIVDGVEKQKVLWGGVVNGHLVGASKVMFGDTSPLIQSRPLGKGIRSLAVFGGGAIAEQELEIASRLSIPVEYHQEEAQNPEEGFPFGRVDQLAKKLSCEAALGGQSSLHSRSHSNPNG